MLSGFILGVRSSIVATGIVACWTGYGWPTVRNFMTYNGIRVSGSWTIVEQRDGVEVEVGSLVLKQFGAELRGTSTRRKNRSGEQIERQFGYRGFIHGQRVVLLFEDQKGSGFDTGSYIFNVQNDGLTMIGKATFHGHAENAIVAESRMLRKVASCD